MKRLGCLLLMLWWVGAAEAATIDARLIRAGGQETRSDERLSDIAGKLKTQFGYPSYRQLGAQQQPLPAQLDKPVRLDLGEGFTLFITPLKPVEANTHTVKLEWYSGKAVLVNSTVKLSPGSHLLIKGPDVANGAIVLAVSLKP